MNTLIKAAYGQFDANSSAVPTEFTLLRAGWNEYVDGKLLFDETAAQSVMQVYSRRGLELMADYEHQSLSVPPVVAPASAKRWTPELRNGDLIAANIQWTEKAAQMIAAGEYRYWSIACRVDPKTMRVVEVVNFGLTNTPAANGIQPLMAASITGAQPEEQTMSKTVLVALGLNAELDESAAVAEAAKLAEFKRDILALSGKTSLAEALGELKARSQSHEQVVALSAEVAQLKADKRAQEFDALVKQGEADAKISPAMAKGEWIAQLRGKADGCEQLRAFLASAPKLVQSAAEAPKETVQAADELTAHEIAVTKRFVAEGDADTLNKRLEALRALKRAEKHAA